MSFKVAYFLALLGCAFWLMCPSVLNIGETPAGWEIKVRTDKRNNTTLMYDENIESLTGEELACYQLPESIAAFTEAVRNETETTALSTWTHTATDKKNKSWIFPQLDKKLLNAAFSNRSVAIVGDSTTVLTLRWLYRLLSPALSTHFVESLATRNLTKAYKTAESHLFWTNKATFQNEENEFNASNGAHVIQRGFHRPNQEWNCEFDALVWPDIVQNKPDILLVNWGLHMFFRERASLCNVEQFVHYESYFMERVFAIAQQAGTKLVLFKTTNRICNTEEQQEHVTEYHERLCNTTLWQWKENATVHSFLMKQNEPSSATHNNRHQFIPSADEIDFYCRDASMSEASVQTLNQRVERYIEAAKQRHPNMTVAVYNDHDMESCAYKGGPTDGLHYPALQLPRVRLLAHMIQCVYPRDDS